MTAVDDQTLHVWQTSNWQPLAVLRAELIARALTFGRSSAYFTFR